MDAVAGVNGGLDEPNTLPILNEVEAGHQHLRRFGGVHRSVVEMKLCHDVFDTSLGCSMILYSDIVAYVEKKVNHSRHVF
jgi:hypothetical protein